MTSLGAILLWLTMTYGVPQQVAVTATFYGSYFDVGIHQTADGTVYSRDLPAVAVPVSHRYLMGKPMLLQGYGVQKLVVVRDTCPGCRWPHVDLPDGVWEFFGESSSGGVLKLEVLMW